MVLLICCRCTAGVIESLKVTDEDEPESCPAAPPPPARVALCAEDFPRARVAGRLEESLRWQQTVTICDDTNLAQMYMDTGGRPWARLTS
jgi:hypothetical protein